MASHTSLKLLLALLILAPIAFAQDSGLHAFAYPLTTGVISSRFGMRADPLFAKRRTTHVGLDLPAPQGTTVHAAGYGTVIYAGSYRGYGGLVVIAHGQDVTTHYAHLARVDVRAGERVTPGMQLGTVGMTGRATAPHLHFEVRVDGSPKDPIDYLPGIAAMAQG